MEKRLVLGNVTAQLMIKLGCEIPRVTVGGKPYYILIPLGADQKGGKESEQDLAVKNQAAEFGLHNLKWTHLPATEADSGYE